MYSTRTSLKHDLIELRLQDRRALRTDQILHLDERITFFVQDRGFRSMQEDIIVLKDDIANIQIGMELLDQSPAGTEQENILAALQLQIEDMRHQLSNKLEEKRVRAEHIELVTEERNQVNEEWREDVEWHRRICLEINALDRRTRHLIVEIIWRDIVASHS